MSKLGDWLSERFESVVNVEVNTISAHGGMTGRKMPPWPSALCDIADAYASFLRDQGEDVLGIETGTLRTETFRELHRRAETRLDDTDFKTQAPAPTLVILYRIKRHSELLQTAITQYGDTPGFEDYIGRDGKAPRPPDDQTPRLPSAMATQLRKIWELGTNTIELQTVFQLDGDIVNRVALHGLSEPRRRLLRQLHRESIERSFSYWTMIFDIFGKIFGR